MTLEIKQDNAWSDLTNVYGENLSDTQLFQALLSDYHNIDSTGVRLKCAEDQRIVLTQTLTVPRSPDAKKKPLTFSPRSGRARITFNINNPGQYNGQPVFFIANNPIRFENIDFVVHNSSRASHMFYVEPQIRARSASSSTVRTWNGNDTDSSFINCTFTGFNTRAAIIINGRNVLIEGCKFFSGGQSNSVGIWHYFNDIYETNDNDQIVDTEPGQCRKNRIFNCEFDIPYGTAIRCGLDPNDWNTIVPNITNTKYFDIWQFHISNNIFTNCRIAHFKLSEKSNVRNGSNFKPELTSISFDQTTADWNANASNAPNELIYFQNGQLGNVMISGKPNPFGGKETLDFKGRNKVKHCLHITDDLKGDKARLYIDADFKGFKDRAIVVGESKNESKFNRLKILGEISGGPYSGRQGVGYYKKNKPNEIRFLDNADANKVGTTCYD